MLDLQENHLKINLFVLNHHKQYGIHLWDRSNWEKEGLIYLYQFMMRYPEVLNGDPDLRTTLKEKFLTYIKEQLRVC